MKVGSIATLVVAAAIVCVIVPMDADAGGRKGRGGTRGVMRGLQYGQRPTDGRPVLTREQLHTCVAKQAEIKIAERDVDVLKRKLDVEEDSLDALAREIDSMYVDNYSQESVDAYNARVDEHKSLVASFNSRLPAYNAAVEGANAHVGGFNFACADRWYYVRDWPNWASHQD